MLSRDTAWDNMGIQGEFQAPVWSYYLIPMVEIAGMKMILLLLTLTLVVHWDESQSFLCPASTDSFKQGWWYLH